MIKLCYKEFELGTLSFDEQTKEYIYNSNLENEQKAKEKYSAMEFYYLSNSVDRRSKRLFDNFTEFSSSFDRSDIVRKAKIEKDDSIFEKLTKIAKLNLFYENFYIKN